MNLHDAPLVLLPCELSDETAATLLEILYDLARVLENHYFSQIRRYYQQPDSDQPQPDSDEQQLELWDEPPF